MPKYKTIKKKAKKSTMAMPKKMPKGMPMKMSHSGTVHKMKM